MGTPTKATEYQRGFRNGEAATYNRLQESVEETKKQHMKAKTELMTAAAQLAQANAKLTYALALIATDKKPFGG
jgi:hypothetical protein